MFDTENPGPERRERSLLSLGHAASKERAPGRPPSLLAASTAESEADAGMRHRLARSRRETYSPRPDAWAERDEPAPQTEPEAPKVRWNIADLIPERFRSDPTEPVASRPAEPQPVPRERFSEPYRPASAAVRHDSGPPPPDGEMDQYWRPMIDPMKVISGIANSKMLILSTTILGALLGVMIALSTPKKYEAVTELLVDPRDLKIVDSELTQSGLPSDATMAIVENQVRVLTSGTVLNKVVDKLNLASDPEFNGQGEGGIGSIVSSLRSLLSFGNNAGDGVNERALAVGHLAESLHVERSGKTFVVVISAKTESAEKSALIANTLTDVFLQTYGEIQSGTAGRATDELTSRLEELRNGVEEAERKVETFKAEHDLIDAQGRLITDDEIVKLNDQLSIARARTIELNAKAASTRDIDVNSVLGGTLPEQVNSPAMTELRSQYASQKQEADRLAVRLGPRHPQLLAIQAQLAGARDQIDAELRRIVSSVQIELKRAVQLEQDLAARLAQIKVRQGGVGDDMVTLRELERESSAKRAVYEAFLLRSRETGEQRDLNTANMSVISIAYPPLDPVGPSRSMIALSTMMLGFFAGVGLGGARGAYQSLSENIRPQPRGPGSPARVPSEMPAPPRNEERGYRRKPRADAVRWSDPALGQTRKTRIPSNPEWSVSRAPANRNTADPAGYQAGLAHEPPQPGPAVPPRPQPDFQQYAAAPQPFAPVPPQPVYPPAAYHQPLMAPPAGYPYPPQPVYYPAPQVMPAPYGFVNTTPGMPMPAQYPAYPAPQPANMVPPQPPEQPQVSRSVAMAAEPVTAPRTPIEEVRDSLREFREAVRDFSDSRARHRRY